MIGRWFGRGRLDDEIERELADHHERLVDLHLRAGLSPDEARRQARLDLGGSRQIKEAIHDARGLTRLESIAQDLRYGARVLARHPGFTVVAVTSLALAIAANTVLWSVTNSVLLRPLPFSSADRLVRLYEVDSRGGSWPFSAPDLADVGRDASAFDAVGGARPLTRTLTDGVSAISIDGAEVTPSFFRVLDLSPLVGTTFSSSSSSTDDATQVADRRVVITERLWREGFASRPDAVGGTLHLDGEPFTVVGVVRDLESILPGARVLLPLDTGTNREGHDLMAVARLAPSVTPAAADAELARVAGDLARRHPVSNAGWTARAVDLKTSIIGGELPRMIWVQFGAVALFGLLACVNVAGLLLARGADRQRELAVRAALGAGHGRLVRQLVVETALLSATAAVVALALTAFALQAVRALGPALAPRLDTVSVDASVLAVTLAFGVVAVLACGIVPAVVGARRSLRGGLGDGARTTPAGAGRRGALVGAQAAVAMTLVVGAALLFRSFLAVASVDPGFDVDRLLAARPVLAGPQWSDERLPTFFAALDQRLDTLPGVEAAGATNVPPFGALNTAIQYRRADEPDAPSLLEANWRTVTPGFFKAMGLPILSGRAFGDLDTADSPDVVIVTRDLADRTWPGEVALGKQLVWGRTGPPKTVVGVVPPIRDHALDRDPQPTMFRAYAQLSLAQMTVLVRTSGDPVAVGPAVRNVLQELAPGTAVELQSVDRAVSDVLLQPRIEAVLFATFAGLALAVAAVGLYGATAYIVRQRRREIAIRTAFGAPTGAILRSVFGRSLAWTSAGIAVGIAGGLGVSRALAALLFETRPTDALAYLGAGLVLVVTVASACIVPAKRALTVDPIDVLRHE